MTFKEVKKIIQPGDKVINTFGMRYKNYYEVYRNNVRILNLTYNQFQKITEGLNGQVFTGGLTKHVYIIK